MLEAMTCGTPVLTTPVGAIGCYNRQENQIYYGEQLARVHRGEYVPGAEFPRPGADRGGWEAVCGGEFYIRANRRKLEGSAGRNIIWS